MARMVTARSWAASSTLWRATGAFKRALPLKLTLGELNEADETEPLDDTAAIDMQEAGQPLRLRYAQAPYGPYAENLRHVLREIEGYFVSGYADGGDAPDKELELVPGAAEDAERLLAQHAETRARFERVADLVQGFETPFGLELLSTVHWVVTREKAHSEDEVTARVYAWNERKRRFSPRQIALARDVLARKGWIVAA